MIETCSTRSGLTWEQRSSFLVAINVRCKRSRSRILIAPLFTNAVSSVKEHMALLCKKFCPAEIRALQGNGVPPSLRANVDDDEVEEEEEEEEVEGNHLLNRLCGESSATTVVT